METDITTLPPPPYISSIERSSATLAEIEAKIDQINHLDDAFQLSLAAFKDFLSIQESATMLRGQLTIVRSQIVLILEECARYQGEKGDLLEVLAVVNRNLTSLSRLRPHIQWEVAIKGPELLREPESDIFKAYEELQMQLLRVSSTTPDVEGHRQRFLSAQQDDRARLEKLLSVLENSVSEAEDVEPSIQEIMCRALEILVDPTMRRMKQQREKAKQSLAILAEMTGQPLPPSTLLGKEFVTVGTRAISQGTSYDIFLGEYFTGEKIAIKVLRHRVDQDTARSTHEKFARQAINWSSLRHDCIVPFYGVGVAPSRVSAKEFQLQTLDIASGLHYMHTRPDLKPGNGLVHSALNVFNVLVKDSGRAVISGFGQSKVIQSLQKNFTGDDSEYRYMGPEMLDEAVLTYGTDIWSWAMTALEILTDEPPYGRWTKGVKIIQMLTLNQAPSRATHPKLEEYESADEIWRLFEDCWKKKPEDRPTANDLVQRLNFILSKCDARNGLSRGRLSDPPVSSTMSAPEIIWLLSRHGCPDITTHIILDRCSSEPIAGGGFGDIYEGYLRNGLKVAIKCPRIFIHSDDDGRNVLKSAAKEAYTWSKYHHPNILEASGLAQFRSRIALVSPWMEYGTVLNYINQRPDADRCKLCMDVVQGLVYLHDVGTVHGDLKGLNILVSKDGVARLTDFGNTVLKQYTLQFTGTNNAHNLSMRWAAPELISPEDGRVSMPADIYALGMTILEIITGKQPYDHITRELAVFGEILKGKTPPRPVHYIPTDSRDGNDVWNLLLACWKFDPKERPTASDVEKTLSGFTMEGLKDLTRFAANDAVVTPHPDGTTKELVKPSWYLDVAGLLDRLMWHNALPN
ncbi:hypothetical protein FRC11_011965 [Ceratobasidium sp. 423]|nr:hypothetical protein FRC11_011965 [Ceratobasidium sp. 423]